ncbi:putative FMN/FAD exporter YeeO [Acidipropionibacterium virtanenii]|uniref:Probable multidrug resistance protein NorM n=2 Tax=Acidipropionibacterium virtanenii TaxID=2057246 RepID=A0A344UR36_9ACTN|nr:putative FMN/FAD exporter YeeO [Acidipropionibacterium virtanenii]
MHDLNRNTPVTMTQNPTPRTDTEPDQKYAEKQESTLPVLPAGVDDTSAPDPERVGTQALENPGVLRRRITRLAVPALGENALENALDIVNTVLVSALGAAALAGAGAALQVMQIVISALTALSTGASILVAHAVGADEPAESTRLARQALMWSLMLSVPIALGGVLGTDGIVSIFGLAPAAAEVARSYLVIAMASIPVLAMLMISGGVLRGAGDARTPMYVTMGANVINIGLAYALIHGHFGLPQLGVAGAAIAGFIARTLALVAMVWLMAKGRAGVSLARPVGTILVYWKPRWDAARAILKLGLPAAAEQLVMSGAWLAFTMIVARLGTETMAAQRVTSSVQNVVFLPGLALMIATTSLVGQALGARHPLLARQVAGRTERWGMGIAVVLALVVWLGARPIMGLFTDDPQIIALGAAALPVMMLTQPFWAWTIQNSGMLRGMRDTISPLVIEAIGNWSAVAMVWFIVEHGGGLTAAWWAFVAVAPLTSLAMTWRKRVRARKVGAYLPGETLLPRLRKRAVQAG